MSFLLIVILIGLAPAMIARSKGRDFLLWWFYGSALFIVALPHALMMGSIHRRCPFCAEEVKRQASVCRHCGRDLPPPPAVDPGIRRAVSCRPAKGNGDIVKTRNNPRSTKQFWSGIVILLVLWIAYIIAYAVTPVHHEPVVTSAAKPIS
jgi:hypothetical protein